jgi:hypothetical protein
MAQAEFVENVAVGRGEISESVFALYQTFAHWFIDDTPCISLSARIGACSAARIAGSLSHAARIAGSLSHDKPVKIKHLAASHRFLSKRHEYKAERGDHGFFPDWLNRRNLILLFI